jgi:hypothetical protein
VKLHGALSVNGRAYQAGDQISGLAVYPFFLIHMLAFGLSGFALAYGTGDAMFVFMHGGIAIGVYTIFYLAIFGLDEVKWMFINAALGIFGIVSQIDWILRLFGRSVGDYPWYIHVVPVLYFVLYPFLIRHAVLDLLGVRDDEEKRSRVEYGYVAFSVVFYLALHFLEA